MTEGEARRVLCAYRFSRPRVVDAVTTLVAAGIRRTRVAEQGGLTRAAVTKICQRNAATLDRASRVAQP